ncbi:MAG TPA: HEAT repeat domain-containing protein [Chitinophagaceae bacterium]|nr:HEAT repeat domain-containing protein [Chitinophagaceae bacterium]
MSHTKQELIKLIDLDEPDYETIVPQLTKDDIPLLAELAEDANPAIATKAISCLGFMNDVRAFAGVEKAAKSANPVYRIAASHALRNMTARPAAATLLEKLLDDDDIGVKKFALKTVEASRLSGLKEKVKQMQTKEANEHIRSLSKQVMEKL